MLSFLNTLSTDIGLSLSSGISLSVSTLSTDAFGLSSLVSQPSSLPSAASSQTTGFSISVVPSISSTPASGPTTAGTPLPEETPVSDFTRLNFDNDTLSQFLGCVSSTGLNGEPLFDGPYAFDASFTQVTCREFCDSQPGGPYLFHGLEQGNLCHCSRDLVATNALLDNGACNMPASGDPTKTEAGGGRSRSIIFRNLEPEGLEEVRRFYVLVCSKLALHKIIAKVGIG